MTPEEEMVQWLTCEQIDLQTLWRDPYLYIRVGSDMKDLRNTVWYARFSFYITDMKRYCPAGKVVSFDVLTYADS